MKDADIHQIYVSCDLMLYVLKTVVLGKKT
jgi:hypothetical protein